jgi:hypothetical protein
MLDRFIVTRHDVVDAVHKLKSGERYGFEGFSSDYIINACRLIYVV